MTINVPFRYDKDIWAAADEFRNSPDLCGLATPPVDVIYIAEVILKLDVIPVEDLFARQRMDAALLPDLTGFYIDKEAYLSWEAGQQWVERRLRFSFAHELGHFVLHGAEIRENKFESFDEFKRWTGRGPYHESAEYQANEFAGRLLVPRDILLTAYDDYCRKVQDADPSWREIEGMREHVSRKLAPRFGVNHQVISIRLDKEGIWPVE